MAPNNNTCTVCGLDSSSFIDKRSFRNHVDKHLGVEFKCPPCEMNFSTALSNHKQSVQNLTKEKIFLIVLEFQLSGMNHQKKLM